LNIDLIIREDLPLKFFIILVHSLAIPSPVAPHAFSTDDWAPLLQHPLEIMKQPIALRGDMTILVETPTDILKI
jgi:arsenate reductase